MRLWMVAIFGFSLCVTGCASRGSLDVLEAQMLRYETRISELEAKLEESQDELSTVRRESQSLRVQQSNKVDGSVLLPEQAALLTKVTGIRFHKLLTSAEDTDGMPGDDQLNIVLIPVDDDGDTLKLPGVIQLSAYDFADNQRRDTSNTPKKTGYWEFTSQQSREYWRNGFLASGYHFKLPWQETPVNSELLLHARFTSTDGRNFDTTKLLKIDVIEPDGTPSERDLLPPAPEELDGVLPTEFKAPKTDKPKEMSGPMPFPDDDVESTPIETSDSRKDYEFPKYR